MATNRIPRREYKKAAKNVHAKAKTPVRATVSKRAAKSVPEASQVGDSMAIDNNAANQALGTPGPLGAMATQEIQEASETQEPHAVCDSMEPKAPTKDCKEATKKDTRKAPEKVAKRARVAQKNAPARANTPAMATVSMRAAKSAPEATQMGDPLASENTPVSQALEPIWTLDVPGAKDTTETQMALERQQIPGTVGNEEIEVSMEILKALGAKEPQATKEAQKFHENMEASEAQEIMGAVGNEEIAGGMEILKALGALGDKGPQATEKGPKAHENMEASEAQAIMGTVGSEEIFEANAVKDCLGTRALVKDTRDFAKASAKIPARAKTPVKASVSNRLAKSAPEAIPEGDERASENCHSGLALLAKAMGAQEAQEAREGLGDLGNWQVPGTAGNQNAMETFNSLALKFLETFGDKEPQATRVALRSSETIGCPERQEVPATLGNPGTLGAIGNQEFCGCLGTKASMEAAKRDPRMARQMAPAWALARAKELAMAVVSKPAANSALESNLTGEAMPSDYNLAGKALAQAETGYGGQGRVVGTALNGIAPEGAAFNGETNYPLGNALAKSSPKLLCGSEEKVFIERFFGAQVKGQNNKSPDSASQSAQSFGQPPQKGRGEPGPETLLGAEGAFLGTKLPTNAIGPVGEPGKAGKGHGEGQAPGDGTGVVPGDGANGHHGPELVLESKNWFLGHNRKLFKILAYCCLVLLLSAGLNAWLLFSGPAPVYFAVTNDMRVQDMPPLGEPAIENRSLGNWAGNVVAKSLSLDFLTWRKTLLDLKGEFDPDGFESYLRSLESGGYLVKVEKKRMSLSCLVEGAPVITNSGPVDGVMTWQMEMPLALSYESSEGLVSRLNVIAEVSVKRTSLDQNARGVAIKRIVLASPTEARPS
jgi:hypothetical protein